VRLHQWRRVLHPVSRFNLTAGMVRGRGSVAIAAGLVACASAAAAWGLSVHSPQAGARERYGRMDFGIRLRGTLTSEPFQMLRRGQVSTAAPTHSDRRMFSGGPSPRRVWRVGERSAVELFRIERDDGSTCYAAGQVDVANLFDIGLNCPTFRKQSLISPSNPIIVLAQQSIDMRRRRIRLSVVAGFASDGVAWFGIRDRAGREWTTRVVDNTFATRRLPADGAAAFLAWDRERRLVWAITLKAHDPVPLSPVRRNR
jgi:hypothetical protein